MLSGKYSLRKTLIGVHLLVQRFDTQERAIPKRRFNSHHSSERVKSPFTSFSDIYSDFHGACRTRLNLQNAFANEM